MRAGVQRLVYVHERATLAFLARAPYDNVFLTWLILNDRSNATRSAIYVYIDDAAQIRGVAFFGRQVVIAADGDDAVDALAQTAPAYRFERMIVGPRTTIERYWTVVRAWHAPPRLTRESQPVLMVDRARLHGASDGVVARRARPNEWEQVAYNSAKMIEHELEYDPRSFSGEFNTNVRQMIDRGLWWVGEHDGRLCFFCNMGPYSEHTLQLQGIWTPPELRGRGLATAALVSVCAQLLENVPTLSLYVNGFNDAALALYERIGFERVGEFTTLLF